MTGVLIADIAVFIVASLWAIYARLQWTGISSAAKLFVCILGVAVLVHGGCIATSAMLEMKARRTRRKLLEQKAALDAAARRDETVVATFSPTDQGL
ncbi:hypothetical protein [Caballeronia novacaledonica]|uniref:hypothetical protein n=1 Tax=Caballeronia novacaledonica TaxID=1544861 RepID=UPI0011B20BB9|nr:hypothetical protein [Caballeronia novacaledonica]